MQTLSPHFAAVWIDFALLAFLLLGLIAWKDSLAPLLRDIRRSEWLLLLSLLGVHAVFIKPFIPHNIWHEQLAVSSLLGIDADLYAGGMDDLHGAAFPDIMFLLDRLFLGRVSIFSLNYLVSLSGVLLLFLLVRRQSGRPGPAAAASALLLFLPIHTRLATTETRFILLESLLVLTLLLFTLFFKTRDSRHLLLGLASALLAMHTRAEMLLLVPAMLAAYCLIVGRLSPRIFLRPAIAAGIAAAAMLCVPRALELHALADPRVVRIGELPSLEFLRAQGINAFFDPSYTPAPYMVLFLAGTVVLFRKDKRLFAWLTGYWVLGTYFYLFQLSSVSLNLRTALFTQFIFVVLAAHGCAFMVEKIRSRNPLAPHIFLLALISSPLLLQRDFLGALYTKQQEYLFLKELGDTLPPESAVVYLSEDDDAGLIQNRSYQKDLLTAEAHKRGRDIALVGIRRFLDFSGKTRLRDAYFYKGIACYTLPWTEDKPHPEGPEDFVNPWCGKMEETFTLSPIRETAVTKKALGWDPIQGERRVIGLYRLRRKDGAQPADLPSAWARFAPPLNQRLPRSDRR